MAANAHFQMYGLIGHIVPGPLNEDSKAWTGVISGIKRAHELEDFQIQKILQPDNLERYFVAADRRAQVRCSDGRPQEPYSGTAKHKTGHALGAQAPGGAAASALCWRVASEGSIFTKLFTLRTDIATLSELLEEFGFEAGAHINDSVAQSQAGCDVIDAMPKILQRITTPETQEEARGLLRLILGETYNRDALDSVVGRFVSLQGKKDEYFDHDQANTVKPRDSSGFEKPTSNHHEVAFVINTVPETTFDRDRFAADNKNDIQAFNYDFWLTLEVAEKLFPIKLGTPADEAARQQYLRQRYVMARALFAVGMMMVLTDGSIELVVRHL